MPFEGSCAFPGGWYAATIGTSYMTLWPWSCLLHCSWFTITWYWILPASEAMSLTCVENIDHGSFSFRVQQEFKELRLSDAGGWGSPHIIHLTPTDEATLRFASSRWAKCDYHQPPSHSKNIQDSNKLYGLVMFGRSKICSHHLCLVASILRLLKFLQWRSSVNQLAQVVPILPQRRTH